MKYLGLGVFSVSVINTLIVVFAYRDVSIPLILMFLVTLVGLPMGIYLMNKKAFGSDSSESHSDDLKVEGLFSRGYENR
jgi:hypothetical protein